MRDLDPIVDGLERDNYVVLPNFFTKDEVDEWYADAMTVYQQGLFRPARIGKDNSLELNNKIRTDEIFWLNEDDDSDSRKKYFDFLEQLRLEVNRHFMLGIFSAECHYTYYQKGSFYKKHLDQHQNISTRKLSVITYLNKDWKEGDGGELKLYLPDDYSKMVKPCAGTVVCFFSALIPHEVLEVRRERIGLTSWLRSRESDLL